jgi:hypothetical protein
VAGREVALGRPDRSARAPRSPTGSGTIFDIDGFAEAFVATFGMRAHTAGQSPPMRHLLLAGRIALSVLCVGCPTDLAAAEKKRTDGIRILEATYGGNCDGVAKGNVTRFVAATCEKTKLCNYRVYYKNMGGDPMPSCEKDFKVTYTCGRNSKRETCALAAEAGMGGEKGHPNHFCLLHCLTVETGSDRGSQRP